MEYGTNQSKRLETMKPRSSVYALKIAGKPRLTRDKILVIASKLRVKITRDVLITRMIWNKLRNKSNC